MELHPVSQAVIDDHGLLELIPHYLDLIFCSHCIRTWNEIEDEESCYKCAAQGCWTRSLPLTVPLPMSFSHQGAPGTSLQALQNGQVQIHLQGYLLHRHRRCERGKWQVHKHGRPPVRPDCSYTVATSSGWLLGTKGPLLLYQIALPEQCKRWWTLCFALQGEKCNRNGDTFCGMKIWVIKGTYLYLSLEKEVGRQIWHDLHYYTIVICKQGGKEYILLPRFSTNDADFS